MTEGVRRACMNDFDSPTTTILLLDSDRDSRATLRDALESAGYLVVSGADLGEALDRLARHPARSTGHSAIH
jgi:CheY-like chemotaxis protein